MKKLTALLVTCTVMTGVFTSCGHDIESPVADNVSVSESETESTEPVTESDTEDSVADDLSVLENETEPDESVTGSETSVFVGKWQGEKIITDGEETDEFIGIPVYAIFQFELCEDGSVTFGETTAEFIKSGVKWSWRRLSSPDEIELFNDFDDDTSVLTFDGEYLADSDEYEVLYLVKVDEFTPYDSGDFADNETESENSDITGLTGKWNCKKIVYPDGEESDEIGGTPLCEFYQIELTEDGSMIFSGTAELTEPEIAWKWRRLTGSDKIGFYNDVNDENMSGMILDGKYLVITDKYSDEQFYFVAESLAE